MVKLRMFQTTRRVFCRAELDASRPFQVLPEVRQAKNWAKMLQKRSVVAKQEILSHRSHAGLAIRVRSVQCRRPQQSERMDPFRGLLHLLVRYCSPMVSLLSINSARCKRCQQLARSKPSMSLHPFCTILRLNQVWLRLSEPCGVAPCNDCWKRAQIQVAMAHPPSYWQLGKVSVWLRPDLQWMTLRMHCSLALFREMRNANSCAACRQPLLH